MFGYPFGDPDARNDDGLRAAHAEVGGRSTRSSTGASDRHPRIPYHETVIYEAHVKGLTSQHPEIPEALRGTYAGLAHPVGDRPPASGSASPPSS